MFGRFKNQFSSVSSISGDSVSIAGNIVTINGKRFELPKGKSISVRNRQIYVDGALWEGSSEEDSEFLESPLTIHFEGDVASIQATGSVQCGNVHGSVNAGYDVKCENVGGSVNAGYDVKCTKVGGSVSAGGDVKVQKT